MALERPGTSVLASTAVQARCAVFTRIDFCTFGRISKSWRTFFSEAYNIVIILDAFSVQPATSLSRTITPSVFVENALSARFIRVALQNNF